MARTGSQRRGRATSIAIKAAVAVVIVAVCAFGTTFMTPEEAEAVLTSGAHDHGQLLDALQAPAQPGTPTYIIAHSHKGHPVSFMSDKQPWHHKLPSPEEAQTALAELEALA